MSLFRGARGGRAQTATIGFILITVLAVGTASAVVVLGNQAINDVSENSEIERAEVAMTQFDASAARVALGESPSQTVDLPSARDGSVRVDDSTGWITVKIDCIGGGQDKFVDEQDLGAVIYEQGQTKIAYQGGGVWRKDGEGDARLVSPPEFHYRGKTLTLPIISISNSDAIDGKVRIRPVSLDQSRWPEPSTTTCGGSTTRSNPVASGKITVVVKSEFFRGWGEYFEERTTGTATYFPSDNKVQLELTSPVSRPALTSAVSAGSGSTSFDIEGTGGSGSSYTDSYDSDSGDYSTSQCTTPYTSCNGDIVIRGDVNVGGNAEIRGTVRSGSDVVVDGNGAVEGDVYYYDSITGSSEVTGNIYTLSERPEAEEVLDPVVDSRVNTIQADNDNGAESEISGNALTGGTVTIGDDGSGAATYYLEEIDLSSGDTLTIDTSDGDVTIAVKNYVRVKKADIEVTGSNRVNIWVKGVSEASFTAGGVSFSSAELVVDGGEVNVPGDKATQFFVYGKSSFKGAIIKNADRSTYDGVIYAPVGSSGSGEVALRQSDLYGGIVTGGITVENKARVHFDRALETVPTVPSASGIIPVTYIHVTVNDVEMDNA